MATDGPLSVARPEAHLCALYTSLIQSVLHIMTRLSSMLSGEIDLIETPDFIQEICELNIGQQHIKHDSSE